MKRIFFVAVAIFMASIYCKAQQAPGTFALTPKIGVLSGNYSENMPAEFEYFISTGQKFYWDRVIKADTPDYLVGDVGTRAEKNKVGLTMGAECQYQFTSVFGLSLGVLYSQEGARYNSTYIQFDENIDNARVNFDNVRINVDCITVPLLANVYVFKGLALKVGLQPEFAVRRRLEADVYTYYGIYRKKNSINLEANVKPFFLSMPVGVSYEYKNVVADLRYSFGLTNLKKHDDIEKSGAAHSRMFAFTLGYKFAL